MDDGVVRCGDLSLRPAALQSSSSSTGWEDYRGVQQPYRYRDDRGRDRRGDRGGYQRDERGQQRGDRRGRGADDRRRHNEGRDYFRDRGDFW